MRRIILGLIFIGFVCACGVDTMTIDRVALIQNKPTQFTPEYDLPVFCQDNPCSDEVLRKLDADYGAFIFCMADIYKTTLSPDFARGFEYFIVPMQFDAPFHEGYDWYGGETHLNDPIDYIILAYDTPYGELPFIKHELRDACVFLGLCPSEVIVDVPNQCTDGY